MIPITRSSFVRPGSFIGDPNGFVALPQGTMFRRRFYEYKIMVKGQSWKVYEGVYYEPNPREYENDSYETLWIKTTPATDRNGWVKLPPTPIQTQSENQTEEFYLIIVGDGEYLSVDGGDTLIYQ